MQIEISKLRELTNSVLSTLEKFGYPIVEIPYDYYWDILGQARYEMGVPPMPSVKHFSDDWSRVTESLKEKPADQLIALTFLPSLLKVLGDELPRLLDSSLLRPPKD